MTERLSEIGAFDIADALGRPRPTVQQKAVIEAPLQPSLVVAGAGSGKTETMANRVLWLLANQLVQPAEILGLTFTRKAAHELSARIRERIGALSAAGMLPEHDILEAPTVATYNSYANTLYRDNASVLGRESDGSIVGEAGAWQLARSVVVGSKYPRLADLDRTLESVTRAVLGISRALADNVADAAEVWRMVESFVKIADLPAGGRGAYPDVDRLATDIGSLDVLLELAADYGVAKLRRGLVEYSDQVALALEILRRQPSIAELERQRFRVVLLDEYQDTSVVQTWLLAELFGGHPVMAVGDPNQSIYGWRGASASNLESFASQFAAEGRRFALSTSWRNGHGILATANQLVLPFRAASKVAVERLEAAPHAGAGPVTVEFAQTITDEAAAVADWLAERLRVSGRPPSAAMLFRTRSTQSHFLDALRSRGVPYHVLGVGGILAEPEIADLVSALAVVEDPAAGLELVRLLAGSRWRIGVADLHALSRLASWLRDRDYAQRRYEDHTARALRDSVAEGDGSSIVDALDFLSTASLEHGALEAFTPVGLQRLRDAGRMIARLRSRSGLDLPDFVAFVMQELHLDIEVAANDSRPLDSGAFDAFFDAIESYRGVDDGDSLRGFLSWLREAEHREDLSPRPEDPEPGTVQVLTVHGAKGLEWDLVVVPRWVEDELPSKPLDGFRGWLSFGHLPWPFRGDAAELPVFHWETAENRKAVVDEQKSFADEVRARSVDEERRLAYVAVTRARDQLLLTGSFWSSQTKPRHPSRFLSELAEAGVIAPLVDEPESDVNPSEAIDDSILWPMDPLGSRRDRVERAAELVRTAPARLEGPWQRELSLLIEERRQRTETVEKVGVPIRIPASRFKDYVSDAAGVALSLRRPMPEKPYRATQLGTVFHAWVENRSNLGGDIEELDALPGESDRGDETVDRAELDRLRAVFEKSRWAGLKPVEVEREIHLPFDGRIVICKIDAVYELPDDRFEIVDWKTGKPPRDARDLEQKQLQLALYRLAYARWKGIDSDRIDAVLYYVSTDEEMRPDRLFGEGELIELWREGLGENSTDTAGR